MKQEIKVNVKDDSFTKTPIDNIPEEHHEEIVEEVKKKRSYVIPVLLIIIWILSIFLAQSMLSYSPLQRNFDKIKEIEKLESEVCYKLWSTVEDKEKAYKAIKEQWLSPDNPYITLCWRYKIELTVSWEKH